ncbi:hypothetical protein J2T07_001160 [Luteibacter jiangsuensis]|uniref:Dermonecrotic toxin N-terminal domain-containing protein n=1 Tax=Luteibacter jiangsuensis TaxID=637577 RepID=A0ABT9SVG4_9GAMM|nr:DUF6543 domain-containing protein [Luteibacter jiangsuensis]MDQ0008983.1 hypothetical protein [Luteibacter jiangsuensis]
MDVPPTTPHAVVQLESEAAVEALRRLATTRDAFLRMYETQPTLDETHAQGAQRLLDALPGFWMSPEAAGGEIRSTLLGRHLANTMKEEATLRGLDGTLGEDAVSLATRVAMANDTPLPAGIHARELMLGDVPHAGSLIVVDDRTPHLALLFTTHGGWEAFDSHERLLESTRRRLLESIDAVDGAGMENDAFAEAKTQGAVGSREITAAVFPTLAKRLVEVQLGRIALAVDDHRIDGDDPGATTELGDRIRHELSPSAMLDIDAIESLREARLIEAAVALRLADVPYNVRTAWYEARDAYNDALAMASMLRAVTGMRQPLTLHAFASRELAAKLASLGIDESPEAITVEVARMKVLPEPLSALDPLPGSTNARRVSLVDLACQNIGRFSLETLHAMDAQGTSLRDRLGQGAIRDMVRDLDIANRYQTHIEQRLRQGAVGALARKLTMTVQAARMRLDATEARLSYYLSGEPRSFIDDREERGFRWIEAALDAPGGPVRVGRHEITVFQLMYRQVPLDGILIFGSRAPDSAPRIVMYTPDAPDGLTFREFASRQDAAKHLLYHPAFREYLLDRLPAEFATVSSNGARREFAGDHRAHWVLGPSRDTPYTLTAEPFGERQVHGDFLSAAYDATVEKYRRDTRFLSRSTTHADGDALLGYLQGRFNVDAPGRFIAATLAEVPASLARMTQASWRFYDHVKSGDTGQAFVAFTEGYVNALNLVVPPFVGGRHIAGAIVRSRTAPHGLANTGVRLPPPRVRFDDRYVARHLRTTGRPDENGIFRVRGQSYIEQDGKYFLVSYHDAYGRWRLGRPQGSLDTNFTGPLIERIDGRWAFAHDVGPRGGMRRLRQRFNRMSVAGDAPPPAAPAVEAVPPVAPVPEALPALDLPPVMEPLRAEITAVLTDNPSASPLVREDGTHLKFAVRPRSALIIDSNLHPDIAALSVHQRRVFLHELDARFPLASERVEVLNLRGWAHDDGRLVPSPPPSPSHSSPPGIAQGADIQSPSISSSTGDPAPPTPTLTPSQQGRWDDALNAARNTPRSPQRPSVDAASSTVTEPLPATEVVPFHEWPQRVWYFRERRFTAEFLPGVNVEGVTLADGAAWVRGPRSYPVSVLPPESPVRQLSEVLGMSPVHRSLQRDPLGYWMQIDTASLHEPWRVWAGPGANPPWTGPGFEMRRRVLPSGEYQYTLHSHAPIHIPSTHIINVGRRGERATPLGPVRH